MTVEVQAELLLLSETLPVLCQLVLIEYLGLDSMRLVQYYQADDNSSGDLGHHIMNLINKVSLAIHE